MGTRGRSFYKARNFEIFQDFLTNHGMAELADDFLYASGRLQTLCYKADIEAALRTKNFGGFQLLGINDFSGQGTALVGALDAFWDDKGYTDAAEYRRFCNSFVPLARMDKLIFLSDEPFKADIELANYKEPMTDKTVRWNLHDKAGNIFYGQEVADGKYSEPFTAGPAVAASGTSGELWVEVPKGVTCVNTGVVIGGSAKLVKSGKGVYRTTVLNQTYTGGTRVADGIFDQGVTSANDSMPLGQNEVTVVFDKEADIEWNDGCYFSWETRPANTTFTLSQKMLFKGFVLIDGIYIRKPKFYIFFR